MNNVVNSLRTLFIYIIFGFIIFVANHIHNSDFVYANLQSNKIVVQQNDTESVYEFIDSNFWNTNPSSNDIISALYGLGDGDSTAYTLYWDGYDGSCSLDAGNMMVEYVDPGVGALSENLSGHTIYVLTAGVYSLEYINGIHMNSCTAIIGNGEVYLYSTIKTSNKGIINNYGNSYGIIDNIKVDSEGDGQGGTHEKNILGIYIDESNSNTINDVQVYNNSRCGLYMLHSNYGSIYNSQFYNNETYGILYANANHGIINNVSSYNNDVYGIQFHMFDNGIVNNTQIYNNEYGIFLNSSNYGVINNTQVYNNYAHGIRYNQSANSMINNTKVYNNNHGIFIGGGTALGHKYYGELRVFDNAANFYGINGNFSKGLATDAAVLGVGWDDGFFNLSGCMTCDWFSNPKNNDGIFLIDMGVHDRCDIRGQRSSWNSIGDVDYLYGSLISKQSELVEYVDENLNISEQGYDLTKFIAEINNIGVYTGNFECNGVVNYANCELPRGGEILHGESVLAYQNESVSCGLDCVSQARVCDDGMLDGSYENELCTVDLCTCEDNDYRWSNDDFITEIGFWDNNPNTCDIIGALYGEVDGDDTAYTLNWSSWNNECNVENMTIEHIYPGNISPRGAENGELGLNGKETKGVGISNTTISNGNIPNEILENTIYVLHGGVYMENGDGVLMKECSAILGKGDVSLYSESNINGGVIKGSNNENIIVDNVKIDGEEDGNGGNHIQNYYGVYLEYVDNYTFNNIQISDNVDGLYGYNADKIVISNSQLYDNQRGLLGHYGDDWILDNSQFYNNDIDGVRVTYGNNWEITNSKFYNNIEHGFYGYSTDLVSLNNSQFYNNNLDGIKGYLSERWTVHNSHVYNNLGYGIYGFPSYKWKFNDDSVYNNNKGLLVSSVGSKYYGELKVFDNDVDFVITNGHDGYLSGGLSSDADIVGLGRENGYVNLNGCMMCDLYSNPINNNGEFMMNTGLYEWCDFRGQIGDWDNEGDLGYLYGSLIKNQKIGVVYNGWNLEISNLDYDVDKFVSEINKIGVYTGTSGCDDNPCELPRGGEILHGESIDANETGYVEYGYSCEVETRTCDNGVLDGTYEYETCEVGDPMNCELPRGGEILHGESIDANETGYVEYGYSCEVETRTCDNGVLDGTYEYETCEVGDPMNCELPRGGEILHGESVDANETGYVEYGYSCEVETRTCDNGVLDGTYEYETCEVGGYPQERDFVTIWKTDNNGVTDDNQLRIHTYTAETYNYDVDCDDDGVFEMVGVTSDATCMYDIPGIYTVRIRGLFPRIYFNNEWDKEKILSVKQWGVGERTSMKKAFYGCLNLGIATGAIDVPDFSNAYDLSYMFAGAENFNEDVGAWNMAGIIDISSMFYNATSFDQYIGDWDVSDVEYMTSVFENANNFNQYIGNWDVSNVGYMTSLFESAENFNQQLGNWNTSNVIDMSSMFKLAKKFNQNIGNWDTSNVVNISNMFARAEDFNQPLNNWEVSDVTNMSSVFRGAESFNQLLGSWNMSHVFVTELMFAGAEAFNQPLNNWDVSHVGYMGSMFAGAINFNQSLNMWETSNLVYAHNVFNNAVSFDQNIGNWDMIDVLQVHGMFNNVTLSTANYDALLTGWATQVLNTGMSFDGGDSKYCLGEAARAGMINNDEWFITDGGLGPNCESQDQNCELPRGGEILHGESVDANETGYVEYGYSCEVETRTCDNGILDGTYEYETCEVGEYPQERDFVTIWKTDNKGVTEDNQLRIHTYAAETYNYDVDCDDDGVFDMIGVTSDATCTYDIPGIYTVRIRGLFPRIYFNNEWDKEKILSVKQWGVGERTSMKKAFYGCLNLGIATGAIDEPNLSNVTNMNSMFWEAWNFNEDIGGWNVSNVVDMGGLFDAAEIFNQNIGNWDVSNVIDMSYMFAGAEAFNQPLNGWIVDNVVNLNAIFAGAEAFNYPLNNWNVSNVNTMVFSFSNALSFNHPLNDWNVSSVTSIAYMFNFAETFNQPLDGWDVSDVVNMRGVFKNATLFNQDIGSWDVSNVIDMEKMFSEAINFNQNIGNRNIINVGILDYMFSGIALSVENYDALLTGWNSKALQNGVNFDGGNSQYCLGEDARYNMIYDDEWFITDGGLDPSCEFQDQSCELPRGGEILHGESVDANETGYIEYGYSCEAETRTCDNGVLDGTYEYETCEVGDHIFENDFVTIWKTNNDGISDDNQIIIPTNAESDYNYNVDCNDDGLIDVANAAGNVVCDYDDSGTYTVRIRGLFPRIYFNNQGDKNKILSVKQWGVGEWDSMEKAFYGCSNLGIATGAIDEPNLSNVMDMKYMFCFAENFNENVGGWDVSNITDMRAVFYDAILFNQDIGGWDLGNVTTVRGLFHNASSFNQDIGDWNVENVIDMYGMFGSASLFNQYIGDWNVTNVTNMSSMFNGASEFNQNIGSRDVINVSDASKMFENAVDFNQNIGGWDTNNINKMDFMFANAIGFDQDIGDWNVENVDRFFSMFEGVGLSIGNYDALLIGWEDQILVNNINFDGGNSQYCLGEDAKNSIINNYNWNIADGGINCEGDSNAPVLGEVYISNGITGYNDIKGKNYYKGNVEIRSDVIDTGGIDDMSCHYTIDSGVNWYYDGMYSGDTIYDGYCFRSNLIGGSDLYMNFGIEDLAGNVGYSRINTYYYDDLFPEISPVGEYLWTKKGGGSSMDNIHGIVVSDDNIYVVGSFWGTATFGSQTFISNGAKDVFISKLGFDGEYIWTKQLGGVASESAYGIRVDEDGDIYVVGEFGNTVIFGSETLTSVGGSTSDMFITKISSDGEYIWAKSGGGVASDLVGGLSLDEDGNVYVIGKFEGTAMFGSEVLVSSGFADIFITKLSSDGNYIWTIKGGGDYSEDANGIDIDVDGNIYVVGKFNGTSVFGSYDLTTNGTYDMFVVKVSSDGEYVWARQGGGVNPDIANGVSVSEDGNVYIVGEFIGEATFGELPLYAYADINMDMFVVKISSDGDYIWVRAGGGEGVDRGSSIQLDNVGDIYVGGSMNRTSSFGDIILDRYGGTDAFVAKLSSEGNYVWAINAGGVLSDKTNGIDVDEDGNIYTIGYFSLTSEFGLETFVSSGAYDIFISKIEQKWLFINNNNIVTNSVDVELNINCLVDAGVEGVEIAYGNELNPVNWTGCEDTKPWVLSDGDGTKTVYIRSRDALGNITANYTDTIELNEGAKNRFKFLERLRIFFN